MSHLSPRVLITSTSSGTYLQNILVSVMIGSYELKMLSFRLLPPSLCLWGGSTNANGLLFSKPPICSNGIRREETDMVLKVRTGGNKQEKNGIRIIHSWVVSINR